MQDLPYSRLLQMPDDERDLLTHESVNHQYEQNTYYDLPHLEE